MEDADQGLHQPADDFADDPEGPEWHVEAEEVVFVAREEYDQTTVHRPMMMPLMELETRFPSALESSEPCSSLSPTSLP